MNPSDHYRAQREKITALLGGLTDAQLATRVPGCPEWTVRDLASHLVGVPADLCSGTMEGAGGPDWTARHVATRSDRGIDEVLEEWTARGPGLEAQLDGMGFLGWVFTFDVTLHGDDVREALGMPLGDSPTHVAVLEGLCRRVAKRAQDRPGTGSLTLRAGEVVLTVGEGAPTATLTVPTVGEGNRVVGDRRTDEQVRALDWTGDPEPWLPLLPLFRGG